MTHTTTTRRATIIHGFGATPEDHWFGWLARQFQEVGISTTVPALPESESPDRDRWLAVTADAVGTPDEGSILVAHSLGCITLLRHLCSLEGPWRVGALVLVSGFVDRLPALPMLDGFVGDGVDVAALRDHVDRLTVIRSDTDSIVPPNHTDHLAHLLRTSAQVVPGAGHFLASDGVTWLPEAVEAVMAVE